MIARPTSRRSRRTRFIKGRSIINEKRKSLILKGTSPPSSTPPFSRVGPMKIHCVGRYLRRPRPSGKVQTKDHRQDGGCGLIEKSNMGNHSDSEELPPPIIAFDNFAFSYSEKKEDYLYEELSFGIENVLSLSPSLTFPSFVIKDLFPHLRNLSQFPVHFSSVYFPSSFSIPTSSPCQTSSERPPFAPRFLILHP